MAYINLMPDVKDPAADLDYLFDWSDYLEEGETITDYELAPGGLTASKEDNTGTAVTVWFAGGEAASYEAPRCTITTSSGRIDVRTMTIRIETT
jgi:hypothetical protein